MSDEQPEYVDVECYILVEPQWKKYAKDAEGRPILAGGRVVKHTQTRPTIQRDGVSTKLKFRFPASSFLPLQPEAIIEIKPWDAETIQVVATNPGDDSDAESSIE